jgi:hypothetical protein
MDGTASGLPATAESAVKLNQGKGLALLRAHKVQLGSIKIGIGG